MPRTHVCNPYGAVDRKRRCRACEEERRAPKPRSRRKSVAHHFTGLAEQIPRPSFLPPRATAPKSSPVNRIAFVIDRSGSMGHLKHEIPQQFASLISGLKTESAFYNQDTFVTLLTFADFSQLEYANIPVNSVPAFAYNPDGYTALANAVLEAVKRLKLQSTGGDESFMVIVLTDGQENASSAMNKDQLPRTIAECQSLGNWSFVFQMPPGNRRYAEQIGVPAGNIREWEGSKRGLGETVVATSQGFGGYYQARSRGQSQVQSFYVKTDLSGLKPQDLKDKLSDVTRRFTRPKQVQMEMDIKTFVEGTTGEPYRTGKAFYQLTKKEKVQTGKELLIMEKDAGVVYGGNALRSMLGFPYGAEATVDPGNHANFDLFVQSTSTNRKLVRGTKVLVRK